MADDLAPRLQRSLGDAFTLERELGGGGMARVFLALDRALERKVVVKVLDLEGAVAASAERFRREVKVIAQLQHPHIVPVLTAGGDDTLLWYVMPYVAGESVRARLVREGALPLADAMRIGRELLDALAYAHEHGIVHRDVKPENILLEGRHAVVADFGVAKALADAGVSGAGLTSVGMALGTPAYMAPEQAMADPTTNHRADLYAAGAVLFEMLAGTPPYSGNAQSVVAAHLSSPVPRIEDRRNDVPPAVATLIARLMAKTPAERPQTANEVAVALEAVTTPGGSVGVPASVLTPGGVASGGAGVREWRGIRGGTVTVAAIGLVAIVAGALWWQRSANATSVVDGADVIAVMPPGTTDPGLEQASRDLVVLISTALDGVGAIRATDPSSVLMQGASLPQPIPLVTAMELGKKLQAGSVIHGSLVREGTSMRADVALHRVDGSGGDDVLARVSVAAPLDSLRTLADALVIALLGEVWARGTPPTPILDSIATGSPAALRAYLEGERWFAQAQPAEAVSAFERSIRADSNFAQAYRRLAYVRQWYGFPVDAAASARLRLLSDRLPLRDREIMAADDSGTYLEQLERFRFLAAKYPDHPTAQWGIADRFVHSAPFYGVAMREALPYIDRLEEIAPNHADNATHRAMIGFATLDSAQMARGVREMVERTPGSSYTALWTRNGGPLRDEDVEWFAQFAPDLRRSSVNLRWLPGIANGVGLSAAEQVELLRRAERRLDLADMRPVIRSNIAHLFAARGDFLTASRQAAELEGSAAPNPVRIAGARYAAHGAWLGTVPTAEASRVLERWSTRTASVGSVDRAELAWLEGLVSIAVGDSAAMESAAAKAVAADTIAAVRRMRRSLRALWRERHAGMIDSLHALVDEEIAIGISQVALPIHRLALGRGLVRAGDPVAAERYLQWTDALNLGIRTGAAVTLYRALTAYERGVAAQEAGDRERAIAQLERFVRDVDLPGAALQSQVADAKARLARLKAQDR